VPEQSALDPAERPIVTTTSSVPERAVTDLLGIVRGNTVEEVGDGTGRDDPDRAARTLLSTMARDEAIDRMTAEAAAIGADAVLDVSLETSTTVDRDLEVVAYGTAVELDYEDRRV